MNGIVNRRAFTDLRLLGFTLGLLLVGALVTFLLSPPPQKSFLSSRSDERTGALALRLWLERSGYTVADPVSIPDDLDDIDVLFVLEPDTTYTPEIASDVRDWVRRGNTLIVAGAPFSVNSLVREFDLQMQWLGISSTRIAPPEPTLNDPPVESVADLFPYGIESDRDDVVFHLFVEETPILASFSEGAGEVWVSGLLDPFTNLGIQDEQHARLILNFLANARRDAHIGFDEGLYVFGGDVQSLDEWIFGTPPGWGVLGIVGVSFVYLLTRGRRFGRPLPLLEEKLRREPVEYIRAIARLFRRAGGRDDVLKHYRDQFRRRLSVRYGVDPTLSDTEFVRSLVYSDPTVDEASLRDLLGRLNKSGINESTLLETVNDVDSWLRKIS